MKKIFTLLLSMAITLSLFAFQNSTRITITSMGKSPIRVQIDGRNYSDAGNLQNEIYIRDIRPGYRTIRIYQARGNRPGGFGPASSRIIFESRVYVKPNHHIDILINRFGKALLDSRPMSSNYYDDYDDQHWNDNNTPYYQPISAVTFDQLKQTIRNEGFDNTRLSIARQAVSQHYFTTNQVKELLQLFSFEESKLDLAKFCYSRTVDKNNYFLINEVFNFSASKTELARFIQANP